jgi:PKD repeat protein
MAYRKLMTIPVGAVDAALVGFPVPIDLSRLTATEFSHVTNQYGYDLEFRTVAGDVLPCDVINFDSVLRVGYAYVKFDVAHVSEDHFYLTYGGDIVDRATRLTRTRACWADYELAVFHDLEHGLVDHAQGIAPYSLYGMSGPLYEYDAESPQVYSHQGVYLDRDTDDWTVTDNNYIRRYNSSWVLQATNSNPCADIGGVNHLGDPDGYGDYLYIPCCQWDGGEGHTNKRIARFTKTTLAYVDSYSIDTYGGEAALTIDPVEEVIYAADGYGGSPTWINKYSLANPAALIERNSTTLSACNGLQLFRDQGLWFSSNISDKYLYKIDLADYSHSNNLLVGSTSLQMEGLTTDGSNLYILRSSGPGSGYVYKLNQVVSEANCGNFYKDITQINHQYATSRFTSWTLAISVNMVEKKGSFVNYTRLDTATPNDLREAIRWNTASDRFDLWNSVDGSLLSSFTPTDVQTTYRLHATHNATTSRSLFVDGEHKVTDTGCVQRPGSGGTTGVFVFNTGLNYAEHGYGRGCCILLCNGVLSDARIKAEGTFLRSNDTHVLFGDEEDLTSTVDFRANPISGDSPLSVEFTDLTDGTADSRLWEFGDGETSTEESPTHTYAVPDTYTVTLHRYVWSVESYRTKTNYVWVRDGTPSLLITPRDDEVIAVTIPFHEGYAFTQDVDLDDSPIRMRLAWNDYGQYWVMDLLNLDDSPILSGIKLVLGYDLLTGYRRTGLPTGSLYVVDPAGVLDRIEQGDFTGDRGLELVYLPREAS